SSDVCSSDLRGKFAPTQHRYLQKTTAEDTHHAQLPIGLCDQRRIHCVSSRIDLDHRSVNRVTSRFALPNCSFPETPQDPFWINAVASPKTILRNTLRHNNSNN